MTTFFRVKRRSTGSPGAPSSLLNGELAYNEVDNTLYYGFGISTGQIAASVSAIAGLGASVMLFGAQSVGGLKTFTTAPLTSASISGSQNDGTLATTAWVTAKNYLTANQTITVTGDVTGSGTSALALTLATVNSSVGTYFGVTVNAKGLITGITPPTTVAGFGITNAMTNAGGSPSWAAGTHASRPAAGNVGARYYETDTFGSFYDNGVSWALNMPALTGDITTTAGSLLATLPNIATPGTYFNVTVNAKGQVTAGTNPTTVAGFGISNAVTNAGSVSQIQAGTLAARPAAGSSGRIYVATDSGNYGEYYDTGATWVLLESAVTGDITIPAGNTVATLPVVNSNVGTYTKLTVNAKGQVTAASLLSATDIPNITTSQVTSLQSFVNATPLSSFAVPSAAVPMNSQNITGLADPVNPQDAATKNYVDASRSGLNVKSACRVVSTTNVTVSNPATAVFDGVTLSVGDRILLVGQTTASQNGLYNFQGSASAMTRTADANGTTTDGFASVTEGLFTFIPEGTVNAGSGWVLMTSGTITVGTTSLAFTQFSGAGELIAGNGITKSGNTLSAFPKSGGGITIDGTGIYIAATYAGQASLITLGTVTTGVWNGTIIAGTYGGLGANAGAFNGYLSMTSGVASASTTIPNTSISGLGTMSTQVASSVAITGGTIDGITLDGGTF